MKFYFRAARERFGDFEEAGLIEAETKDEARQALTAQGYAQIRLEHFAPLQKRPWPWRWLRP